jgi:phosphoglycolate phosphatase-like HAD superfamily hydrolase
MIKKEMREASRKEFRDMMRARAVYNAKLLAHFEGKASKEEVILASNDYERARQAYRDKIAPYVLQTRPLNQALKTLDDMVIPALLAKTGRKVEPVKSIDLKALEYEFKTQQSQ